MGKSEKKITNSEIKNLKIVRKSIVAIKDISRGETLTKENIWVKRPGTGDYLADDYESLLGKVAKNDIVKDEQVRKSDV